MSSASGRVAIRRADLGFRTQADTGDTDAVPDGDRDQMREALNCCRSPGRTGELSGLPAGDAGRSAETSRPQIRSRWRPENPWLATGQSGAAYAAQFDSLAARGVDVHGEVRLVAALVSPPGSVLDTGCDTGRVAARLADLGYRVVGVDLDESMLAEARRRAPHLDWHLADLAALDILGRPQFDAVVAAGNSCGLRFGPASSAWSTRTTPITASRCRQSPSLDDG